MRLPVDAEADIAFQRVAIPEIVQAGVDQPFAEDGIAFTVETIGAADAQPTPQTVLTTCQTDTCQIGAGSVAELVIEIGDAIEIGAVGCPLGVLPGRCVIEINTETALQAFAAIKPDGTAETVDEAIRIH